MSLKDSFILCGNRYGKGDIGMAYLAWLAFYKPVDKRFKNRHIDLLNTSISQDQANIIFNKFEQNLLEIDTFSWMIKDVKKSPFPNINFKNDVTLWFRNASQNGKYLEGRSYFHINFDEADLQDNYYKFVMEILAPRVWDFGGNISHMTTPRRGTQNSCKVYMEMKKEYDRGNKEIYIHRGDSRENKFIHKKAIEKMNKLPKRLFDKNVLGNFSNSSGIINNELIEKAEKISIGLQEVPQEDYNYVTGWDLARSSTYCCGATIRVPKDIDNEPLQLVSLDRFSDHGNRDRKYWQKVEQIIRKRAKIWGGETVIDKTGLGDVVYSYIEDINPIGINLATAKGALRQSIIDEGISVFEMAKIGIPKNFEITDEVENQVWLLKDEISDFDPEHLKVIIWDMVCAIFLAVWIATNHEIPNKEDKKPKPTICRVKGASKYGYRK